MNKIIEKIGIIAQNEPSKIAYKVDDKSITYGSLYDNILLNSKYLLSCGTSPIIIYGDKSVEYLTMMLSCIAAKRTYVPIGSCTPIDRLSKIVSLTKSSLVITDIDITLRDVDVINYNDVNIISENKIIENENDIAYIIFTSGSTGEPKGVPISYNNLDNFIEWISNIYPLNEYNNSVVLNQASFSFDLSVADIYYSLCNGHTLVSYNDYDNLYDLFKKEKINVAVMTPTFMKLCLVDKCFNEEEYPNLKCVYFCGELLEVKLVNKIYERFPHLKIINAYGPTEATSAVCGVLIKKDMLKDLMLPVGEINNSATEIEVLDDEIVLKGDSVFSGYLGNIDGGYYLCNGVNCYRTGDLGYIKDGLLYIKGRKDSQIKYKGYRIELGDLEYNINKIDGVKDCAVVAIYNDNVVKTIKAFVTVDKEDIDSMYINRELKKMIPQYMLPKTIKIIDKLPVNNNGKIDRKALCNL